MQMRRSFCRLVKPRKNCFAQLVPCFSKYGVLVVVDASNDNDGTKRRRR